MKNFILFVVLSSNLELRSFPINKELIIDSFLDHYDAQNVS